MANPYFQFKQFRVEQDRCGMKVCTDSCLFGAHSRIPDARSILDIGTGTGLLSLMLAQQHPLAQIDAVEIDADAAAQAKENIMNSPWKDRIKVFHTSVQDFSPNRQYDFIICNPPFYPDHLPSAHPKRRQAFHQDRLSFPDLLQSFHHFLSPNGLCSIISPLKQAEEFTALASKAGLYLQKEMLIFEHPTSRKPRSIRSYGFNLQAAPPSRVLYIKSEDGSYSQDFRDLLQPFYLHF